MHTHTDREQHPRHRHTRTRQGQHPNPPNEHLPQTLNNARRWRDDGACHLPRPGEWPLRVGLKKRELTTTRSPTTTSTMSATTTTKILFALADSRSPGPVACEVKECIAIPCSADRFTASLPLLRVLELALHFSTLPCLFFGSRMPTLPAALASACSHLSFFVFDVSTARRACSAA